MKWNETEAIIEYLLVKRLSAPRQRAAIFSVFEDKVDTMEFLWLGVSNAFVRSRDMMPNGYWGK